MINIVEILKDYPKGTKLYSPIFGDVCLDKVRPHLAIVVTVGKSKEEFLYDGRYSIDGECILFPSKDQRDWSKFQRSFKEGDIIISNYGDIHISRDSSSSYCCLRRNRFDETITTAVKFDRLATEEEKQKLFTAIKANGYKWNAETKTLEKLIVPKFKVGDRIKLNNSRFIYTITDLLENRYRVTTDSCDLYEIEFERQDAYKLVPNHKFKVGDIVKSNWNTLFDYKIIKITDTHYTLESIPGANTYDMLICEDEILKLSPNKFDISTLKAYDKVLVRDTNEQVWVADLFSHVLDRPLGGYTFACVGHYPNQCIPYLGNEHLLGTCDDCGEYFKNW